MEAEIRTQIPGIDPVVSEYASVSFDHLSVVSGLRLTVKRAI